MDFYQALVEAQKQLTQDLETERLPARIMQQIKNLIGAENILLVGVDGSILGKWWIHNQGWKIKQFSMDVVRKAITSETGYWRGAIEEKPSESQVVANILSCLAARVEVGDRLICVIYCDLRKGDRRFTDEDGFKLTTIASCFANYLYYCDIDVRSGNRKLENVAGHSRPSIEDPMIGQTESIRSLKEEIKAVAPLSMPVLLLGETGVGKEIAAKMIHDFSGRSGNFVTLNCAAINRELFESELFGHEKGSFSGALHKRPGLVVSADSGTLFLDEVGDIPRDIQVKLLRLLENKKVRSVGSDVEIGPIDFRLICATNKNLDEEVRLKEFRQDLFFRISGVPLKIPPLRDRLEDVPLLANHFCSPKRLTPRALELLAEVRDWPGNIRQLKTVVENAADLSSDYEIPEELIAKQLKRQLLPHQNLEFYDLKHRWENNQLSNDELVELLGNRYLQSQGNWNEVARRFGLRSIADIKSFRNWISYLQKKKILRPPNSVKD